MNKLLIMMTLFCTGFIIGQYAIPLLDIAGLVNNFGNSVQTFITGFAGVVNNSFQGFINPSVNESESIIDNTCSSNSDCNSTSYCVFENCADSTGECNDKPTVCPSVYQPVCACDGMSYDNACLAAIAGKSIANYGFCA